MKTNKILSIALIVIIILSARVIYVYNKQQNEISSHYLRLYMTIDTQVNAIGKDINRMNLEEITEQGVVLMEHLGRLSELRMVASHLPPKLDNIYFSVLKIAQDNLYSIIVEDEKTEIKSERWNRLLSAFNTIEEISKVINAHEKYKKGEFRNFVKDINNTSDISQRIERIYMDYINSY